MQDKSLIRHCLIPHQNQCYDRDADNAENSNNSVQYTDCFLL